MNIPTLPGTLPGLLQPGAPVIWLDCVHERNDPCAGWCVAAPRATRFDAGHCAVVLAGDDDVCFVALDRLALDLSRPEGVDRALRWLAEREGLGSPCPPSLVRFDSCGKTTAWTLIAGDPYTTTRWSRLRFAIGIDPVVGLDDPIEALRLACLAAGGAA